MTRNPKRLLAAAKKAKVPAMAIGTVSGHPELTLHDGVRISLDALRRVHEGWLPGYMSSKN
jgi:hypothetical protein